jgi:hypothetical protein
VSVAGLAVPAVDFASAPDDEDPAAVAPETPHRVHASDCHRRISSIICPRFTASIGPRHAAISAGHPSDPPTRALTSLRRGGEWSRHDWRISTVRVGAQHPAQILASIARMSAEPREEFSILHLHDLFQVADDDGQTPHVLGV